MAGGQGIQEGGEPMSVNERITSALTSLGYPIRADLYTGSEGTYFTFNYATRGCCFGDNKPGYDLYLVQVHFFCPYTFDYVDMIGSVKSLLFGAGFTWPEMENATGDYAEAAKAGRHFVFECECLGSAVDG